MPNYAPFHLGHHCLPKCLFRGFLVFKRYNKVTVFVVCFSLLPKVWTQISMDKSWLKLFDTDVITEIIFSKKFILKKNQQCKTHGPIKRGRGGEGSGPH